MSGNCSGLDEFTASGKLRHTWSLWGHWDSRSPSWGSGVLQNSSSYSDTASWIGPFSWSPCFLPPIAVCSGVLPVGTAFKVGVQGTGAQESPNCSAQMELWTDTCHHDANLDTSGPTIPAPGTGPTPPSIYGHKNIQVETEGLGYASSSWLKSGDYVG